MTSEFDKAAQGVVGGFGGAAEKTLEDERGTLRNTLYDALLSNPEMAARATKLGRQTGLSPDIVERNLPEIERNTRLDQLDAMPKENPVLAAWLSGASNARLAHDDIDNLGQFSNLFRAPVVPKLSENYGFAQASLDLNAARTRSASAVGQYVERNMPASEIMASRGPKASFSSVTSGLGDVLPNTADRIREGVRLEFADLFEREDMAADAMRKRNQIDFSESVITPEFDSKTGRFVYGGASNMLRVAPSITAAILTRNPAVGLAGMAAQVQPEAYGKYRGRGGTPGEAALGSGIETAIEVGTEMLPMGFLVNKFGKAGAKDFLAGYLGRELPTELVAEISQGAVDTAIANPDKTWGQYFSELPDTIGHTVVSTLMMSGGLTAAHTVAGSFVSKQEKAAYAEEQTKVIEQLNQLAASSKVLQRDAETFQSFIAAAGCPSQWRPCPR